MTWADKYRFMKGDAGEGWSRNYATDATIKHLACCIASQQEAGFGDTLDLREIKCSNCSASGFNTGWGYWSHTCGAEYLSDGECSQKCKAAHASAQGERNG